MINKMDSFNKMAERYIDEENKVSKYYLVVENINYEVPKELFVSVGKFYQKACKYDGMKYIVENLVVDMDRCVELTQLLKEK